MKAINHVSEEGLGKPKPRKGRDRSFCRNGGQASALVSAGFVINNTMGKTGFKETAQERAWREVPICFLISLGESFQTLVPCVQKGPADSAGGWPVSHNSSMGEGSHIRSQIHWLFMESATVGEAEVVRALSNGFNLEVGHQ